MSTKADFTGKVALVVGSSSGVGAATAIRLAKSGANLVITGRYALKVQAVANECLKVSPINHKPLEVMADISLDQDRRRLVQSAIDRYGRLDLLVNFCGYKTTTSLTEDPDFLLKYRQTFDLTLHSLVHITHLCVDHLELSHGCIVNISSGAGIQAFSEYTPHSMAKCAFDMFTRCMAVELAPKGIRVNSINHGALIDYHLTVANGSKKHRKRKHRELEADAVAECYGRQYPVGRPGTGDDVASAVLYMSSQNSSFVTGVNFVVDGGHMAAGIAPIVKVVTS